MFAEVLGWFESCPGTSPLLRNPKKTVDMNNIYC